MHLMESFTTLYEASRLPLHRRKLMEVVDLICAHMIDTRRGCGLNQFDMAWNPFPPVYGMCADGYTLFGPASEQEWSRKAQRSRRGNTA